MGLPEIAELIETHAGELLGVWVSAVRSDEGIKSDADLSEGGLVDHVPVMLEEITGLLRSGARPQIGNIGEARVHAYTRFRQGYRARDLVRESSHLRLILLDHISSQLLKQSNGSSKLDRYHEAARAINLYLDEELRYAVSIYTEELKPV
jgi:RsbT co-antagonist protein rsbRD N-terminal domain